VRQHRSAIVPHGFRWARHLRRDAVDETSLLEAAELCPVSAIQLIYEE
jgi:ferredoxin